MSSFLHRLPCAAFVFLVLLTLFSCQDKPEAEGELEITEQEFTLVKDSKHAYMVAVKGRIKNVGQYDVKNVEVTAECPDCGTAFIKDKWYGPGTSEKKTEDQVDTIFELTAGEEKEFSVKDVAFFFSSNLERPDSIPEDMHVIIQSFETVQ